MPKTVEELEADIASLYQITNRLRAKVGATQKTLLQVVMVLGRVLDKDLGVRMAICKQLKDLAADLEEAMKPRLAEDQPDIWDDDLEFQKVHLDLLSVLIADFTPPTPSPKPTLRVIRNDD